jgi:phage FluMu gp28-like protein
VSAGTWKSLPDSPGALWRQVEKLQAEKEVKPFFVPEDPVEFAGALFKFHPTDYQARLLRDQSKRIAVRWSRQAGKTTTIALRAIWFSATHPKSSSLIVTPSLRQSMIMADRVQDFLASLPIQVRRALIEKQQRTVIRFRNGARIIALPNSPQLLRGYTAHEVITDESNFFQDDQLVFYNVLYPMLATTDGALIASSTPWNKDSVFYKMCMAEEFSKHFITWEDVVRAGLIKQSFIEEMKNQLPVERFEREFNAAFVEDVDAWLTQSLIVKCIDAQLQLLDFREEALGDFYIGLDFGKHQDYSVIVVLQKVQKGLSVVHVHRFPLKTQYASVIGFAKSLQDRWKTVRAVNADITGVGDYIVEDMQKSGITNVTGISFTVASKEEMATILREKMRSGEVKIPYSPAVTVHDIDMTAELNVEKFELMKTGHIKFTHPEGSHDDVFWAAALAVYAAVKHPISRGLVDFGAVGEKS